MSNDSDWQENYKGVPDAIESNILMAHPNADILIYEGSFILKSLELEIEVNGKIVFSWFPTMGVCFQGKSDADFWSIYQVFNETNDFEVFIKDDRLGTAFLSSVGEKDNILEGKISESPITGDKSIGVEFLHFGVPNLRNLHGDNIKIIKEQSIFTSQGGLTLENETYLIKLDKRPKFVELEKSLKTQGGYLLLYNGEIKPKTKITLNYDQSRKLIRCLNTFLSFINGRRTSAMFIHGSCEDEVKWIDYSNYLNDQFKQIKSWPPIFSIDGINQMWQIFYKIWYRDVSGKEFLMSSIRWYNDINNRSSSSDSGIIIGQATLELIYNWWLIEEQEFIKGPDVQNISAANKIRMILSNLSTEYEVPQKFTHLQDLINNDNNISDGPDVIVHIRNAIVHSQKRKREKISSFHHLVKYEVTHLLTWYIELAILKLLTYNQLYRNRCSLQKSLPNTVESVPWAITHRK